MSVKLTGLENVLSNLNEEIKKIEKKTIKGLIRATILVRRDMEFTPPLIPVDLGNLRASWFVVTSNGSVLQGASPNFITEPNAKLSKIIKLSGTHGQTVSAAQAYARVAKQTVGPAVVFGFGAYYAAFVHEMVGAQFQRHGAGAQFLSNALARNSNRILKIIADEARIK